MQMQVRGNEANSACPVAVVAVTCIQVARDGRVAVWAAGGRGVREGGSDRLKIWFWRWIVEIGSAGSLRARFHPGVSD